MAIGEISSDADATAAAAAVAATGAAAAAAAAAVFFSSRFSVRGLEYPRLRAKNALPGSPMRDYRLSASTAVEEYLSIVLLPIVSVRFVFRRGPPCLCWRSCERVTNFVFCCFVYRVRYSIGRCFRLGRPAACTPAPWFLSLGVQSCTDASLRPEINCFTNWSRSLAALFTGTRYPSTWDIVTGRSPNVESLGLASAGVAQSAGGHITVDDWQVRYFLPHRSWKWNCSSTYGFAVDLRLRYLWDYCCTCCIVPRIIHTLPHKTASV